MNVLSFAFMKAEHIIPILNVSDISASFAWFEKWGWKKLWDWGTPPTFGAVGSGECEIFLCQGAQGGRGKGTNATTFGEEEETDRAFGCQCLWTTLTKSTNDAWPPDWTSLFHRRTCHGTSAKRTCGTRTGMYFGSARALNARRNKKDKVPRVKSGDTSSE
jgi:hypothetical protein